MAGVPLVLLAHVDQRDLALAERLDQSGVGDFVVVGAAAIQGVQGSAPPCRLRTPLARRGGEGESCFALSCLGHVGRWGFQGLTRRFLSPPRVVHWGFGVLAGIAETERRFVSVSNPWTLDSVSGSPDWLKKRNTKKFRKKTKCMLREDVPMTCHNTFRPPANASSRRTRSSAVDTVFRVYEQDAPDWAGRRLEHPAVEFRE